MERGRRLFPCHGSGKYLDRFKLTLGLDYIIDSGFIPKRPGDPVTWGQGDMGKEQVPGVSFSKSPSPQFSQSYIFESAGVRKSSTSHPVSSAPA